MAEIYKFTSLLFTLFIYLHQNRKSGQAVAQRLSSYILNPGAPYLDTYALGSILSLSSEQSCVNPENRHVKSVDPHGLL